MERQLVHYFKLNVEEHITDPHAVDQQLKAELESRDIKNLDPYDIYVDEHGHVLIFDKEQT